MNLLVFLFAFVACVLLLRSPRAWAPLPLLCGATYMTIGQNIELGPFHFTVIRILIAVGVFRTLIKQEHISGGVNSLDRIMIAWGIWAVCSSFLHKNVMATLVSHLGLVYDSAGIYYLLRVFIQDSDDILSISKICIILLVPVAMEMVVEHFTGKNLFSVFGGVAAESEVRGGRIRAQGPFLHSILAGTVGAVCWPMALFFWQSNRRLAILGSAAAGAVVLTTSSSGPILTVLAVLAGFVMWKWREHMRLVRWGIVLAIVGLDLIMKAPVYYLISRLDMTGSSTGWYRSALIESSIKHLNEWWLSGTDYTRHWMATGVPWSTEHVDITNHYIKIGVLGGLPLMLLFIGLLAKAFAFIGRSMRETDSAEKQLLAWMLGCILFAHAVSMVSISYFDQSIVFFYLALAAISALCPASELEVVSENPAEAGSMTSTRVQQGC